MQGAIAVASCPVSAAAQPRQQPVHGPVAERLDQVFLLDGLSSCQIGYGARHPQDAVPGPDAEPQLLDGILQKLGILRR